MSYNINGIKDHDQKPLRLAIFASGNGTNAQQISEYFANSPHVVVDCVIYNMKDAYVATRAKNLGIPAYYFNRRSFFETEDVLNLLVAHEVDYIILAGFLLLVPDNLLNHFPNRIVNIHPALLPLYGGKGMYGHHVHEEVIAHHEKVSGITVHVVDCNYDKGTTLFQAKCNLTEQDTADTLAAKIHILEKDYFPKVIESYVLGLPMPVQPCPID